MDKICSILFEIICFPSIFEFEMVLDLNSIFEVSYIFTDYEYLSKHTNFCII